MEKSGIVTKAINSHHVGQIKIEGETWTAALDNDSLTEIPDGSIVQITSIDGVKLIVKPKKIISKV